MAISRVSGNILQDNLQRGANLSVQGNLIYFDVTNSRVGVLTTSPQDQFNVIGTANASNVRITSATANGIFYAGTGLLAQTSSDLSWSSNTLGITGNLLVAGAATIDNITLDGTTLSSNANLSLTAAANSNITMTVSGTGVVKINATSALTVPTGNVAQRPSSPDIGALRFNTNSGELEVYDGVGWEEVGTDTVALSDQTLNGDGITTNFVLDQTAYANAIIVSTNGVVQKPNVAYTVAGNVITFAEAPALTDVIDVRFIAALQIVSSITNSSGNTIVVQPSGVSDISSTHSLQLPTYTVAQATALGNTASGQMIYVSNGNSGQPCLAVYSVNAWKIVALGGNITP